MSLIESIRGVKFSQTRDFLEHAFELPDGLPIPYSYPGRRKSIRYTADEKFWSFVPYVNSHENSKKDQKCYIKLWFRKEKWRTCFVVCADFDRTMGSDHTRDLEFKGSAACRGGHYETIIRAGYKVWAQEIQEEIGDAGYVFNSPKSGRPKVLFLIEYPKPVRHPSSDDAKRILQLLLPKYYDAGCLDLSDNALFTTYLPSESRDEIMLALRHLTPIKIQHGKDVVTIGDPEDESQPISVEIKKPPTIYGSVDELPEEFRHIRCGKKFKHFLRTLTVMTSLNHKGFGISQRILARTLEITQRRVSQYIKRAIKLGFLKVIDADYVPDIKAKRYIAKGLLKSAIKNRSGRHSPIDIPKSIPDGEWHEWIQRLVKMFWATPIKVLEVIKTIPGWDLKDRLYQTKAYIKWHVGKHPQFNSNHLISALK